MASNKKKEKWFETFYDLLVKLNTPYKDVFIVDYTYCVGAKESEEEALGTTMCILPEKYQKVLKRMGFGEAIFMDSLYDFKSTLRATPSEYEVLNETISKLVESGEIKDDQLEQLTYLMEADATIDEIYKELNISPDEKLAEVLLKTERRKAISDFVHPMSEDELTMVRAKISDLEEDFNAVQVWEKLEEKTDLIKAIYEDKSIFQYPITTPDGETRYITIAKQLFPMVTMKNYTGAFLNIAPETKYEGLERLLVDFTFEHYRFYGRYHFVATTLESEE